MASKNFSQILKDIRLKAGYTQKDVYEHFGIPQSTFSSWEIGKSEPSGEMLIKLCEFYKCDMMKEFSSIDKPIYTVNEIKLIEDYRKLDYHGKDIIDTILLKELDRIKNAQIAAVPKEDNLIRLSFSECKASAGTGSFLFDGYPDSTLDVVLNKTTEKANECISVSGDSMQPLYYDGDILLVKRQPNIDVGEIGVFIKGNQGYVKQKGDDRLVSLNKDYDDIYPDYEEITCYGKVIGKLERDWIR